MTADSAPAPVSGAMSLTLILERREVRRSGWSMPVWDAVGVFVEGDPAGTPAARGECVHEAPAVAHFRWSGVPLRLHRDAAERYLHNLRGMRPSLFVLCRRNETTGALVPHLVTADYEDAAPQMETDGLVLAVSIPAQIRGWLAAFAEAHYVPVKKKKRQRSHWSDGPGGGSGKEVPADG